MGSELKDMRELFMMLECQWHCVGAMCGNASLTPLEVQCLISLEMVQGNVDAVTWQKVVVLDLDGEYMGFHHRKAGYSMFKLVITLRKESVLIQPQFYLLHVTTITSYAYTSQK